MTRYSPGQLRLYPPGNVRHICFRSLGGNRARVLGRQSDLDFFSDYKVSATRAAPIIRVIEGERTGVMLRWGLIPFFARGIPPKYSTTQAAVESLETSQIWRAPWRRGQRCIMPATAFYQRHLGRGDKKTVHLVRLADQEFIGFAALWDRSFTDDGAAVESCALITMEGNSLMRLLNNTGDAPFCMPALLAREDREAWLTGSQEEAQYVLRQYPHERMLTSRVGRRVGGSK